MEQTWNKLNSKHLGYLLIIDSGMHIFFSIQILSHILGKQNPVKEIAKFTGKTLVYTNMDKSTKKIQSFCFEKVILLFV